MKGLKNRVKSCFYLNDIKVGRLLEEPGAVEETQEDTVIVSEGEEVGGDRIAADGDTQAGPVVPDGQCCFCLVLDS